MIVLTEREVSNAHGTGVLLKNIVEIFGDSDNIVLCKEIASKPDRNIKHYLYDNHKLYKPSKVVTKLLLSKFWSKLYFSLRRPEINEIPLEEHKLVLITIYTADALWATLKIMRIFPNNKYLVFIMDLFIDFSNSNEGLINRRVFTLISKKAVQRLAISKNLASHLETVTGLNYNMFFGPRQIDWAKVDLYHSKRKENEICLIGNAWVEDVLPVVDKQLNYHNLSVTWFTNKAKFEELKEKYNLQSFIFGGSFTSEEVIEQASVFKFGLILYGLDKHSEDYSNRKLQEYSIPSKIIDYCTGGLVPIYYGPDNSACCDFLISHSLGFQINASSAPEFFNKFNIIAESNIDFALMKRILNESSTESFKELISNLT